MEPRNFGIRWSNIDGDEHLTILRGKTLRQLAVTTLDIAEYGFIVSVFQFEEMHDS